MLGLFRRHLGNLLGVSTVLATLLLFADRGFATIYVFDQTAESVLGLQISSTLSINGQINSLPTINSNASVINLSNLLSFSLTGPTGTFSLTDFNRACQALPCLPGFPEWSISPGGISFVSADDSNDFFINGFANNSTIQVDSEGFTTLSQCHFTGACKVTGDWVPIPEPPALFIFVGAVLSLFALKTRFVRVTGIFPPS